MRYRKQSPTGDWTFGLGVANFYVNTPAAVGQAVKTKLRLFLGEVFYNKTLGTDWLGVVMGYSNKAIFDAQIQGVIANTQGVKSIISYSSVLNNVTRILTITAQIDTIYSGQTPINLELPATGYGVGGINNNPYGV